MTIPRAFPRLLQSLTPELRSTAIKRNESLLLKIIQANLNTQYASKTPSLVEFRGAISPHSLGSDNSLIEGFHRHVPLSDYESYKPFMAAFDKQPCKEAEVENLLAPGLPRYLAISSATSGTAPKVFPIYPRSGPRSATLAKSFDPRVTGPTAKVFFYGYNEVKIVEREPGHIVKKIPVSTGSSGSARGRFGWSNVDDDDSRMPLIMPGHVAPWAASMIKNHKSFLIAHALFTLAYRDLVHISITFSTMFLDLVRHMDEEWDMLLSSIRSGRVPDLPDVKEVQSHLQAHLRADPDRAAELGEIGPPFSREGWATRVWPKLEALNCICSGSFATVLPKVKSIIGPTIAIHTPGYVSSESFMAVPHRPDDLDTFVLRSNDFVEFIATEGSHENLRQAWELETGKQYEIVLTTVNGLWRYQLGDTIHVSGFDADDGSPVFTVSGRRNTAIRFSRMSVTDIHLAPAIQAISPDVMQINEFSTVLDDRQSTPTVGYFVELAGTTGPNAHLAPSRLAEGLAAAHPAFQSELEVALVRYPTIRIVRPGTFSEYRQWRGEKVGIGPGQIKVPVVMLDPTSVAWILERVIGEL